MPHKHPPFPCGSLVVSVQGPTDVEMQGDAVPQSKLVIFSGHKDGLLTMVQNLQLLEKVAAEHTSQTA